MFTKPLISNSISKQNTLNYLRKIKKIWIFWKSRSVLKGKIESVNGNLHVIVGSGSFDYEGWVSTDLPLFNITSEYDWGYYFKRKKPLRLLAEHVIEHLTISQVERFFLLAFTHMEKGGSIRIAVPDGFHANLTYLNAVKPGGWDLGANDHKTLWNIHSLETVAKKSGFEVIPLEYFDTENIFHKFPYSDQNGYICRSRKNSYYDKNVPDYTSLIIDLIKN